MFEAQLKRASILNKIIDAVKDLVSAAPFDCTENAICFQAIDPSLVALVSLRLSIELFEEYRCDRTVTLGLNVTSIAKALKFANNDDVCILRFTDYDQDNFYLVFHDAAKTKIQEIKMTLMDLDSEQLEIPDRKYDATFEMSSSEFAKTCRAISQFSDSITIAVINGCVTFSGKGVTDSYVITYTGETDAVNQDALITLAVTKNVASTFSIKYMLMFAKASGLSDHVRLSLSEGVPVVVEYKINEDCGFIRFYLSPKINENADMD